MVEHYEKNRIVSHGEKAVSSPCIVYACSGSSLS